MPLTILQGTVNYQPEAANDGCFQDRIGVSAFVKCSAECESVLHAALIVNVSCLCGGSQLLRDQTFITFSPGLLEELVVTHVFANLDIAAFFAEIQDFIKSGSSPLSNSFLNPILPVWTLISIIPSFLGVGRTPVFPQHILARTSQSSIIFTTLLSPCMSCRLGIKTIYRRNEIISL